MFNGRSWMVPTAWAPGNLNDRSVRISNLRNEPEPNLFITKAELTEHLSPDDLTVLDSLFSLSQTPASIIEPLPSPSCYSVTAEPLALDERQNVGRQLTAKNSKLPRAEERKCPDSITTFVSAQCAPFQTKTEEISFWKDIENPDLLFSDPEYYRKHDQYCKASLAAVLKDCPMKRLPFPASNLKVTKSKFLKLDSSKKKRTSSPSAFVNKWSKLSKSTSISISRSSKSINKDKKKKIKKMKFKKMKIKRNTKGTKLASVQNNWSNVVETPLVSKSKNSINASISSESSVEILNLSPKKIETVDLDSFDDEVTVTVTVCNTKCLD